MHLNIKKKLQNMHASTKKINYRLQKQTQTSNKKASQIKENPIKMNSLVTSWEKMSNFIFRCNAEIRQSSSRSDIISWDLYTGVAIAIACHLFSDSWQIVTSLFGTGSFLETIDARATKELVADKRVMISW